MTTISAPDDQHLTTSAHDLLALRERRAASRATVHQTLDALFAEVQSYLGAVFTANDPVTGLPVALVVKSFERLPDDYEQQSPRALTDTVSRLVVDVLGHALSVTIDDNGVVHVEGEVKNVPLDKIRGLSIRGDGAPATFYTDANEKQQRDEIPVSRVLAELIDSAAQSERGFLKVDPADAPR